MNGLIRFSLRNPIAVTVLALTFGLLGGLSAFNIPVDILPVFRSPAVQVLSESPTFARGTGTGALLLRGLFGRFVALPFAASLIWRDVAVARCCTRSARPVRQPFRFQRPAWIEG